MPLSGSSCERILERFGREEMILNLHGLFGSRENNNFRQLSQLFPEEELYSPQIDYLALAPCELLEDLAGNGPYSLVVGNSLGGFIAYALSAAEGYPIVLTNPCVPPHEYLPSLAREYRCLGEIEALWNDVYPHASRCTAIIGTRDELIDHDRTIGLLKPYHHILTIDSEHRMAGPEYERCFKFACEEMLGACN